MSNLLWKFLVYFFFFFIKFNYISLPSTLYTQRTAYEKQARRICFVICLLWMNTTVQCVLQITCNWNKSHMLWENKSTEIVWRWTILKWFHIIHTYKIEEDDKYCHTYVCFLHHHPIFFLLSIQQILKETGDE